MHGLYMAKPWKSKSKVLGKGTARLAGSCEISQMYRVQDCRIWGFGF